MVGECGGAGSRCPLRGSLPGVKSTASLMRVTCAPGSLALANKTPTGGRGRVGREGREGRENTFLLFSPRGH